MRKICSLTPTVSIQWLNTDPKPSIIVEWYHLGNPAVKQYVLLLDNKEVHYIRDPSKADVYKVCIDSFKFDNEPTEHTVQIIAKLNNDKETYQSDLFKVTIPNKRTKNTQVIAISKLEEKTENEEEEEEEDQKKSSPTVTTPSANKQSENKPQARVLKSPTQTTQNRKSDTTYINLSCGCQQPHKEFPGIGHYLAINDDDDIMQKKFSQ
ncbi:unnamed protein product [Rotaria sp. Silwood2]|nr:unnamed protein product [Rotaria sp. Silwood2]CAF3963139.1 unnamed protein product [Rotaria sp. Silwood2]